jgi:hypothetical protein
MKDARAALAAIRVAPDFSYQLAEGSDARAEFDFVHRTTADAEIYFVRSKSAAPVKATLSFRVKGRTPELWTPGDGARTPALVYRETVEGRTEMPLTFPARGSVFVIFERASSAGGASHLVSLNHNGAEVFPSTALGRGVFAAGDSALVTDEPGSYEAVESNGEKHTIEARETDANVKFGAWTLTFPSGWGAPASMPLEEFKSWTEMQDAGVKYFSGTGTYHSSIEASAGLLRSTLQVWLNLGDVREIASVVVNGKAVETLWREPFVVRVDPYLHAGINSVEVQVTNEWPNRLIGDAQPGAAHYTKTNVHRYTKDSPLLPSGLLTPLTIQVESVKQWRK